MARINGPRKVNRYPAEFKLKAVKLSQIKGVQVQDVADALDIHPFMLSRRRKEVREGRIRGRAAVAPQDRRQREIQQLAQLKCQYALLKEEHELLKKSHPVLFCSKTAVFAFINAAQDRFGVKALGERYGVTRAGYYAWRNCVTLLAFLAARANTRNERLSGNTACKRSGTSRG